MIHPLDHTGDIGFELETASLEELLEIAGQALVEIMFSNPPQTSSLAHKVFLEAPTLEVLLVSWLNELLFLIQTQGLVPVHSTVEVRALARGWQLRAAVELADLELEAQGWQGEVKATTHHGLEVVGQEGHWQARVILDV